MSATLAGVVKAAEKLGEKAVSVGAVQVAIDKAEGLLLQQVPDDARPLVTDVADTLDGRADVIAAAGVETLHALTLAASEAIGAGHDADEVARAWLNTATFEERHARVEADVAAHELALARRLQLRADLIALALEVLKTAGPIALRVVLAL